MTKRHAELLGMELEVARLKEELRVLKEVNREHMDALRESTKLLVRCRPVRGPIPHERKLLVAASQQWRCKNPFGTCPLYRLGDGLFDESLFECDHTEPYSQSFRNDRANLACLCAYCHNVKSRRERLALLEEEDAAEVQEK
jgi:hypothetical protein